MSAPHPRSIAARLTERATRAEPSPLDRAGELADAARVMLDYEEGAESQYRTRAILNALSDLLDVETLTETRRESRGWPRSASGAVPELVSARDKVLGIVEEWKRDGVREDHPNHVKLRETLSGIETALTRLHAWGDR